MSRAPRMLWGAVAGVAAALALPSIASATTSCAFASATHTLTVNHTDGVDTVTLRRVPGAADPTQATINVLQAATTLNCGTPALVTQLDTINYDNSGGISTLVIEEPDTFVPGFTPETGVSEIETFASNTGGILDSVILADADGQPDHYVFGTSLLTVGGGPLTQVNGVNVNPDDPAPDVDISLVAPFFQDFVVQGSPGADVFSGAGGAGTGDPYVRDLELHGGPGNDTLTGTPGHDSFRNDPGDDVIDGAGGDDEIDYTGSTLPVDIDLARPGPQNGGSLGRDTLSSIEQIDGSKLNDVLRGTAARDVIYGLGGDDLIEGRGGDDLLAGGDGTDTVSYESAGAPVAVDLALTTPQPTGGGGTDEFDEPFENLIGGPGADVLRGTAGPNVIEGGPGGDTALALAGDDTVLVRDGIPDTADCGPGNDRATVDPGGIDAVTGCETVSAGVAAGLPGAPGGSGAGGSGASPRRRVVASLKGPTSEKLVRGAVTLRLSCPVLSCGARASGSARLGGGRSVALLATRARILAGKSRLLRLRLAHTGLAKVHAALAAGRRPLVRVTVVVTDAAAATKTLRRSIALLP